MNLAIDIGNTRVKTGVFDGDDLVEAQVMDSLDMPQLQRLVDTHRITHTIVASVGVVLEPDSLEAPGIVIQLGAQTPVPIESSYKTPETLGQDRLAGVVAATWLKPGSNTLVIDAGTCITYDFVDTSGRYVGGNIAPGIDMRYRAMHQFTHRLPSVEREDTGSLLGESTDEALKNGGLLGVLMEIAGYIEILRMKYKEVNTLLTGGDADFVARRLNTGLSVEPHLILIGLNQILQYNVARYN